MPNRHARLWLMVLLALAVCLGSAAGQVSKRNRPAKQQTAIEQAVAILLEEARAAKTSQRLPATVPDFARRFEDTIEDPLELLEALTRPAHKDVFLDAYVRWQLTSFDPPLPDLDERQFQQLMSNAPPMIANPRAEEGTVTLFNQAEQSQRLSSDQLDQLRNASLELDRRSSISEEFNRPALEYRDWIERKLPESGPRRSQWLIERCGATVSAGWPCRALKARLTKHLKGAASDSGLGPADRQLIAAQLQRLVGLKRSAIDEITFLGDGSINVKLTTPQIDQGDVDRWIALLEGGAER